MTGENKSMLAFDDPRAKKRKKHKVEDNPTGGREDISASRINPETMDSKVDDSEAAVKSFHHDAKQKPREGTVVSNR